MLTAETKRRIDACRDVLVGKLPLPTDQVELITLALIYKFMDDLDEESVKMGGKRSFFIKDLAPYRWRNLLPQTVSAEQRMTLFAEGIEALGHAQKAAHLPGLFRDIFRNAFLKFRDGRILTLFLTEVNGFAYSHSEELGNAFEYLLQCMGTQGENGQFRTPRHIIDFMVACLDPRPGDRILDPACGTGGFLVSAFKHILAAHTSGRDGRNGQTIPGDLLTHAQRQAVYQNLAGYDITDLMVKLSKVNLFLHGFPDPAIHIYDTLSNDARWHEKADLILANPPFMTPKGGVTPHTKFRIAARKAEVLFTDYIAEHLTADGRGGVIVPNGIVATTQNAYVKLRRYLVEDSLVAVVSLPAGVFKPYSGVKTSILFLDKKLARTAKEILFLKITADGFDLGDKRTPVEANDLPEAERVVKAWFKGKGHIETKLEWKAVAKSELLARSDASLSAERFMGVAEFDSEHPTVRLRDVCAIRSGGTPSRQNAAFWTNGTTRWISSKHIGDDHRTNGGEMISDAALKGSATNLIPAKSLVLITRVSVGKWAFLDEAVAINQDLTALTPTDDRLLPEFLKCVAPRLASQIDAAAVGVGVRGVTREFVGDLEIPLPPLEEQRRIVAEIEGYQKVLDGARQILAGYRPRLQFNPDWPTTTLGEICEVVRGSSPRPQGDPRFFGGPVPRLMIADITRDGMWVTPQIDSLTEEGAKRSRPMKAGDVVMAVSASPGLPALLKVDACIHDGFAGLKGIPETLDRVFLYYVLLELRAEHDAQADGATFRNITTDQIRQFEIPLPPLEEQRRIVAALDAEAAQMEAVRALIPRFEAKIQRVLDRLWGQGSAA
jgi:type I restriction enzyme M protein